MDDKVAGCLFGMALGDALGAETEFLDMDRIRYRFPPNGPLAPDGNPARVTDDTQMALAVGEALVKAPRPYQPDTLGDALRSTFIEWYNSPDNTRAPGATCMTSIENMINGQVWSEATNISSKGCGANMRVQPVGLLNVDDRTRAQIAQFQAAMTHGHPAALAAADLTAFVIAHLRKDVDLATLPALIRQYALSQREVYHREWLDELWYRAVVMKTPEAYIAHGWDECLHGLDRLDKALFNVDRFSDPCIATGAGWTADEAFATALFCFLMYPDDPIAVIQRAAATSGDSDSIACIAGAFAGAKHGINAWYSEWLERIEYHDRIKDLAEALSGL